MLIGKVPTSLQRIMAIGTAVILLLAVGWLIYTEQQNEMRRAKEVAAKPHTVRILGYQITFPTKIPRDCDGGEIDIGYFNDGEIGQGCTRIAKWWLNNYQPKPPNGGIEFMVNESAQPGILPDVWRQPTDWENIIRVAAGTKEINGLKFVINRVTYESYDPGIVLEAHDKAKKETGDWLKYQKFLPPHGNKLSAIEYLAQDKNILIGIRGYNCVDEMTTIELTDFVLPTFKKFEKQLHSVPQNEDITRAKADGSVVVAGTDNDFIDPAVQLLK